MASVNPNEITIKDFHIHYLHSRKQPFDSLASTESFIEKVIQNYNTKKKMEGKKNHTFLPIPARWEAKEHDDFNLKLYHLNTITESGAARWVAASTQGPENQYQSQNVSFVFFLYRHVKHLKREKTDEKIKEVWEVFALTTNDGCHVVKSKCNFQFPIKVAKRIITPVLPTKETKELVGPKDSSSETYREEYALKDHKMDSLWSYIRDFSSYIKLESSIYNPDHNVTAFCKSTVKNKTLVRVGVGRIVVGSAMTMKHHTELLNYLSLIGHQQKTFVQKDVEEQDDPEFGYLDNIQTVEPEIAPTLDHAILFMVWKQFNNEHIDGTISIVHRFYKDYYRSCEFTLRYSKNKIQWNYRPSLIELLSVLRQLFGSINSFEEFLCKLRLTQMRFDKKPSFFPLTEFFQGEFRLEKKVYFRVDGLWLQIKGNHLSILQQAFRSLLNKHLITVDNDAPKGQLPKPWFADCSWVTFTLATAMTASKATEKDLEKAFNILQKRKFTIVDSNGFVCVPYPIVSLIDRHKSGINFTKTLNKNWESLRLILQNKFDSEEELTKDDLKIIFTAKNAKKKTDKPDKKVDPKKIDEFAQELFDLLKAERPVLSLRGAGNKGGKICILREDDTVTDIDISHFTFTKKTTINNLPKIKKLLNEKLQDQTPCTVTDLEKALKVSTKLANAVYKELKKPIKAAEGSMQGSLFLMEGPLPDDLQTSQPIRDWLTQMHEDYCLVLPEEGYNRLYLNEPDYLVFDQVYMKGASLKFELCDILWFGSEKKKPIVRLYHVKKGFGQKTREACAQIRVAAANLKATLLGNKELLRNLYQQATSKQENESPFRKQVRESFQNLGTEGDPLERFLNLFPTDLSQVHFVYAFVEESANEKFLSDEQHPNFTLIKDENLMTLYPSYFEDLKSEGFLDKKNQITQPFFLISKDRFTDRLQTYGCSAEIAESIFDDIHSKLSQFDSMIAKIELLHLKDYMTHLGFSLDICQIARSRTLQGPIQRSFKSFTLSPEDYDIAIKASMPAFQFEKIKYYIHEDPLELRDILGYILESTSVPQSFYKLLETHKKSKKGNIELFLDSWIETVTNCSELRDKLASVSPKLKSCLNAEKITNDELLEAYKQCILFPGFSFKQEELTLVAELMDLKIVLLPKSKDQSALVDKAVIFNPNGKTQKIFVTDGPMYCICEQDELIKPKSPLKKGISKLINEPPPPIPLITLLSQEDQQALVSRKHSIGIVNGGNTCFFNAAMQIIFHSPLLEHFLDPAHFVDAAAVRSVQFHEFFREIFLNYAYASQSFAGELSGDHAISIPVSTMRRIFSFASYSQEDSVEVLHKIADMYVMNPFLLTERITVDPQSDQRVPIKNSSKAIPKINEDCQFTRINPSLINILMIPEKKPNLQEMINTFFESEQEKPSVTYAHGNKFYSATDYGVEYEADNLPVIIFFQIARLANGVNNTPLLIDSLEVNVLGTIYHLEGFAIRKGKTADSGHFFTYAKTSKGWYLFDDGMKPQIMEESQVKKASRDAYLMYFKRV